MEIDTKPPYKPIIDFYDLFDSPDCFEDDTVLDSSCIVDGGVKEDESEDEDEEEAPLYQPRKSIFDLLDSTECLKDDLSDPAFEMVHSAEQFKSILDLFDSSDCLEDELSDQASKLVHSAVQMSLHSVAETLKSTETPSKKKVEEPRISPSTKAENKHRTAELMKDFAINLAPHTFMVREHFLFYTGTLNYLFLFK